MTTSEQQSGEGTHIPWHHRYAPHILMLLPLPVIGLAVYLVAFGYLPLANGLIITVGSSIPIALGLYNLKTREVPNNG